MELWVAIDSQLQPEPINGQLVGLLSIDNWTNVFVQGVVYMSYLVLGTCLDVVGDAAVHVPIWTEQCKTEQSRQIPPVSLFLLFSH